MNRLIFNLNIWLVTLVCWLDETVGIDVEAILAHIWWGKQENEDGKQ